MNAIDFDCHLDILKAEEKDGKWIIEGLAATTDFDFQDDVISQKAIDESAKDLLMNSTVLYNHDMKTPIGKVLDSKAQKGGLWVKVFISKTAPEIWLQIKEGVINKFSIRGKIEEAKKKWIEKLERWVQVILKMQLVEVSLVTVPANPKAKALRWYIQKALHKEFEQGRDLEQLKGEDNMNATALDEYIEKLLEVKKGEGDTTQKNKAIMDGINVLIANEKDEKKKKELMNLRNLMVQNQGVSQSEEEKRKKEEEKKKTDEGGDDNYSDLSNNTDSAVKDLLVEVLARLKDGKVEKNEDEGTSSAAVIPPSQEEEMAGAINKAIEAIKGAQSDASSGQFAQVLAKFEEAKELISKKSDSEIKNGYKQFETLMGATTQLASKTIDNEKKLDLIEGLLQKFLKGVGAVRNEDGTLSVGKEDIAKGINHQEKKETKADDISFTDVQKSDEYTKASLEEKRDILSDEMNRILGGKK